MKLNPPIHGVACGRGAVGKLRELQVAYLRINCGLTFKEIAWRLGIREKLAGWYWHVAKLHIVG